MYSVRIQIMHTACLHIYFNFFKNLFGFLFTKVITHHKNIQQCILVRKSQQQIRQKAVTNIHMRIAKTVIFRDIKEI